MKAFAATAATASNAIGDAVRAYDQFSGRPKRQ
jgi:hypothetical protein